MGRQRRLARGLCVSPAEVSGATNPIGRARHRNEDLVHLADGLRTAVEWAKQAGLSVDHAALETFERAARHWRTHSGHLHYSSHLCSQLLLARRIGVPLDGLSRDP